MAALLNVDPAKKDDTFYRYKMPAILTKIEGNGNGIKTVFPNIREVCAKLSRPAEVLNKYFGYELGAQSTYLKQDDKFLVMGSYTQERLQDRVYDFIRRFVLCHGCRSPQTAPFVTAKHALCMTCATCGADSDLSAAGNPRLVAWLATYYATHESTKSRAAMPQPKVDNDVVEAVSILDVALPPTKGLIETATEQLQKKNPIVELSNLMRQTPPPAAEKVIHTALQLKTESNLTDSQMVRIIFRAVIEGVDGSKFIGALQQWRAVLGHFILKKEQVTVIKELGIAVKNFNNPEKFPMALKMLWEEGLVGEAEVMDWYQNYKPSGKDMPPAFFESIKTHTVPLIEWLNQ